MEQVLAATDFASARAVGSIDLKELGVAPVCMAPGTQSSGHSHTLVEEVWVIQCGEGQIQIEDKTYDVCAGSVAVVPAGKFHATCNTGDTNLEAMVLFNKNVDRKKVVLKNRKQHFKKHAKAAKAAKKASKKAAKRARKLELANLQKASKKLQKKIRKLQAA